MAEQQPGLSFAGLLRRLRDDAGLTQEELAEAASLSPRSVSDLERGVNLTARHETARLLAGALGLTGPQRALFEAAARGRAPASQVLAAGEGAAAAAATRTLPRDIGSFTGRAAELAQMAAGATGAAAADGGVVGIHAIGGMAGVGKTALAVHAAHRLAGAFPDGQFFLPLHAHTPGQRPVEPVDALASLLLGAGVGAQQIPPGLQARAARWRDHLAGKKVLLLLDDAAGHEQVTPLLPGTAGSLVLVTSRRRLTALEDAAAISLETLAPGEAAALLARLAGRPGLGSGDGPAGEITRLCGCLPLAIGMLARQLHHHPAWTAADLAADLATATSRLELMRAENLSVAAAFDLSYRDLTAGQQRLFRRLGVHPGTDIDGYAAAALDGTDLAAARRNLEGLYDHYLLAEHARGRYRLHDLLAEHARALASAGDPADADAAAGRLLDYYLHGAAAAGRHIETRNIAAARPPPGEPPAVAPLVPTASRASAWLDAERANLDAAVGYAAASGRPGHVSAIPAAISGFLFAGGHWDQSAALHRAALAAAGRAGDRAGQADALNELGILHRATGDFPAAAASHRQALELYRGLGDRLGQASALNNLGRVEWETGDYPAAAASLTAGARAVPRPRSPGRPGPGHHESRQRASADGGLPGRRRQPPAGPGHLPRHRPPARPGPGHRQSGHRASPDRGLPGRYRQPGAGAGHVPRPRRPARPGPGHQQSGRSAAADRGLPGRGGQPDPGTGHVPRPRRPAVAGPGHRQSGHRASADRGLPGRSRQLDPGAGHVR